MVHSYYRIFFIVFVLFFIVLSCQKDDSYFEGNPKLNLSTDTLLFDTVFTSVGSATRFIKIYNDEHLPVLVDIGLEKGNSSFFRINADGFNGSKNLKNIEIGPKDSIYVFIEVTIDPDNPLTISPFFVEENLIITTNQGNLKCLLTAFGQNANYIPSSKRKGSISSLCNQFNTVTWDDAKPYVIYGILIIDSCTLILPPGTNVYVHGGLVVTSDFVYNDGQIIVLGDGKLISQGTIDRPVKIEADRLEKEYNDVEGQWVGIRLLDGSKNNLIENTIIRNSVIGVQIDSAGELRILNSIIENTSSSGIVARHSNVYGENLLLHNNAGSALTLTHGGNFEFNYSTFASYVERNEALFFTNFRCLDPPFCQQTIYNPGTLRMKNCIITGASNDEIYFGDIRKKEGIPDALVFELENCLVRVDSLINTKNYPNFFDRCKDCINIKKNNFEELNGLFLDQENNNYNLDTMSIARMKGTPISNIQHDLKGKPRKAIPDIGCFEFD